jgi:hypothetical protein
VNSQITTGLREIYQSITRALDFADRGSMIFHCLAKPVPLSRIMLARMTQRSYRQGAIQRLLSGR